MGEGSARETDTVEEPKGHRHKVYPMAETERKYEFVVEFSVGDSSHTAVRAYPVNPDFNAKRNVHLFMQSAFTYYNKAKKYSWEAKHHIRGFDCNEYFYDKSKGWIPTGMIPRARDYLKMQYGDRVAITISKEIRNMFSPPSGQVTREEIEEFTKTLDIHDRETGKPLVPFEHQYRLVEIALNRRRGLLFACTSAGKSVSMMIIARYLMEKEHKKILVIVPSKGLVEQLYDNFYTDYGWDEARDYCTLLHGESSDRISKKKLEELQKKSIGEEKLLKQITISTWQTLQHKHPGFFKVFDAVLVDEAHGMRGVVLRGILEQCTNANNFKVGVSGTLPLVKPTRENRGQNGEIGISLAPRDVTDTADFIDACNIESQLGPIYDVVHLRDLIANGTLTPVKMHMIYIPYPYNTRYGICYAKYQMERAIVLGNSSRKDVISMLIDAGHLGTDQNSVILYDGIERLHDLHDFLKGKYPQYTYHIIEGEVSASERESIRKLLEGSTGNILIATYGCMKQGVNIKQLNNLVLAEPAKSMYKVMQSIGRVVRKHPNKQVADVYDLVDDANCWKRKMDGTSEQMFNYMMIHARYRMTYYDAENIPIEEQHMDGIYEAQLTPEDIKKHRKEAADRAAERLQKQKKGGQVELDLPYRKKFSLI